jgi:peroxiredoxin
VKINLVDQPTVPFQLQDAFGRLHQLSDYTGFWLLLVFHRHLG